MNIVIDQEVKQYCPEAALGILHYSAGVAKSDAELLEKVSSTIKELAEKYTMPDIAAIPHIKGTRNAYKALGKSPSEYRNAAESMLRRIVKGNGLYHINNVVEINNLMSITSGFSIGSYVADALTGTIALRRAPDGEKYKGIGKDLINIEHLPTLYDEQGGFGNPSSDSERAMVQLGEHNIISVIYSFDGTTDLPSWLERFADLLITHAGAKNLRTSIVGG